MIFAATSLFLLLLSLALALPATAADYDLLTAPRPEGRGFPPILVIPNGRVIDPETNFDGVRNVGIKMALRDGVTTALDLENGILNAAEWYDDKANHWQVNYGATAWTAIRRRSPAKYN